MTQRLSPSTDLAVVRRLTKRDRQLLVLLWDLLTLTTDQVVAAVGFESAITGRHRLRSLKQLRVLECFRPYRPGGGTLPNHWVLAPLGSAVAAAELGLPVPSPRVVRSRALALACSTRLPHLREINSCFAHLSAATRRRPGSELVAWWPERRCAAAWGTLVRPDAGGVWQEPDGRQTEFALEVDRGTEPHARLRAKLSGYQDLAEAEGRSRWVLFWFAGPRREHLARPSLSGTSVPVATSCPAWGRPETTFGSRSTTEAPE
jgi:hypothetical protein